MVVATLICCLLSFFICGIPFGLFIARKFTSVDVRRVGSKNIGSTNVFRSAGLIPGLLTFLCDFGKSFLCITLSLFVLRVAFGLGINDLSAYGTGSLNVALIFISCILGHIFSPYLLGKGGKGIATGFGAACATVLPAALVAFACWFIAVLLTKKVSIGSLIAAVVLPCAVLIFYWGSLFYFLMTVFAGLLVFWAHRSNIYQLKHKREPRFNTPVSR